MKRIAPQISVLRLPMRSAMVPPTSAPIMYADQHYAMTRTSCIMGRKMKRVAHEDQGGGDDTHVKAVKNASQSGDERDPPDEGLIHVRLASGWVVQLRFTYAE